MNARSDKRGRAAMALIDAILFAVFIALCFQLASPAIRAARYRDQDQAVGREARAIYDAFLKYRERNGEFPDEHADPAFDPATFEPLRRRGYYDGAIGGLVANGRIDACDAPDDQGPNREFWIEMTLATDPSVRILIAKSDDAPLGRGNWVDGAFIVRDGKMGRL